MANLYKELQTVKQMVIDKLTYLKLLNIAQTDKGYKVTT